MAWTLNTAALPGKELREVLSRNKPGFVAVSLDGGASGDEALHAVVGMARYMAVNEPGAKISEAMIARIRKAHDREEECLRISAEIVSGLKEAAPAVKLQALGWEHRLPAVLDLAGM